MSRSQSRIVSAAEIDSDHSDPNCSLKRWRSDCREYVRQGLNSFSNSFSRLPWSGTTMHLGSQSSSSPEFVGSAHCFPRTAEQVDLGDFLSSVEWMECFCDGM